MPLRKRSFTSELLTQQQGEILKVGFLRKKGHVRRNWLDRWFVLTTEGIYYYKNRLVCRCSAITWNKVIWGVCSIHLFEVTKRVVDLSCFDHCCLAEQAAALFGLWTLSFWPMSPTTIVLASFL